jgi:uncharacterized membrane protein YdjX (TVP38/TMEM64 family)
MDKMGEAEPRAIGASALKRWLPVIFLGGLMAVAFAMGWHRHLTLESIVTNREALKGLVDAYAAWAILGYVLVYVCVVALSLPGGGVLTITGGLLFGVWIAAPATVVAATIGATIVFLIAKTSFGDTLRASAGPWLEKFREGFEKEGLAYMLFLRLVPFPFWVINLVPALLGVPLRTFVIGTFIGIIPGTIAFTLLGDTLDRIVHDGKAAYDACVAQNGAANCKLAFDPAQLPVKQILIALTLVGIMALVPTIVKKWRARNATA